MFFPTPDPIDISSLSLYSSDNTTRNLFLSEEAYHVRKYEYTEDFLGM
jgi:hypothetical protein